MDGSQAQRRPFILTSFGCSVFGKMGAWEKAVQVLTIMRSEVGPLAPASWLKSMKAQ